ncbi:MAG: hypothetical protein KAQ65_11350 [Candidatus Thorarchaeota archaeon]|nr:hypothetical protein [Candidatus Thorarchaeota archaeon]MCK5238282.1 hypothetical protein [Candidatus Thorarchaeota archaeon]
MAEAWYSGYSGRIDYVSDLGMAKGSLESVIINPLLAWAIGLGAALVGTKEA